MSLSEACRYCIVSKMTHVCMVAWGYKFSKFGWLAVRILVAIQWPPAARSQIAPVDLLGPLHIRIASQGLLAILLVLVGHIGKGTDFILLAFDLPLPFAPCPCSPCPCSPYWPPCPCPSSPCHCSPCPCSPSWQRSAGCKKEAAEDRIRLWLGNGPPKNIHDDKIGSPDGKTCGTIAEHVSAMRTMRA